MSSSSESSHAAIQYTLTLSDEWRTNETYSVKLGYAMPSAVFIPPRANYRFLGWFDRKGGEGTKYYDANGNQLVSTYGYVGDLTLYAGWELESGVAATVTISVNGGPETGITHGVPSTGTGWSYSGDFLYLDPLAATTKYTLRGADATGEIRVAVIGTCEVDISGLTLDYASFNGASPFTVDAPGSSPKLIISQPASFTAGAGADALCVMSGSTLTITGDATLALTGGAGGADIGADGSAIFLDPTGPDLHFGTGRLANVSFYSADNPDLRLWRVKVPGGFTPGMAIAWGGLATALTPLHAIADANGDSYLWLPDGGYVFSSLTVAAAKTWVARVTGAHREAVPFMPIGFTVNGEDVGHITGPGWYWDEARTLFLTNAGPFTVSGTAAGFGLCATVSCEVTLSDVTIDISSLPSSSAVSPLAVANGVSLSLVLEGTNTLKAGSDRAGVEVPAGCALDVSGTGSLAATGGDWGAGIGGGADASAGTICISGGTVSATGGSSSAGIGGGYRGTGGTVKISGGTVEATGTTYGAGIGGGYKGTGGTIMISGGTVTAQGGSGYGSGGAGLGGGTEASGGTVMISDGIVTANGGFHSAGIGGGEHGMGGHITISGGQVTAQGGEGAAGLGGGINAYNYGQVGSVTISGGTVVPKAGANTPYAVGEGYLDSGTYRLNFIGGSIDTVSSKLSAPAENDAGSVVYRVEIPGLPAGMAVTGFTGLPTGYGSAGIEADDAGKIYVWLPDERYAFTVETEDGESLEYSAYVSGSDTVARAFVPTGLEIDGRDVAHLFGPGWCWDDARSVAVLTNAGPFIVSGTSSVGAGVEAGADCAVIVSNLVIDASAIENAIAFRVAPGADVAITLIGNNSLQTVSGASGNGHAALEIPEGASATLDGEGFLQATADTLSSSAAGGAGIGGGYRESAGRITIFGGQITALSTCNAAGIGGGT
ncbi:MAG: hypothetical protein J6U40_04165, partial [Kiritimatiellae bacterium]|nr:hypothetical protein [Kiritimatiellia bacterium]